MRILFMRGRPRHILVQGVCVCFDRLWFDIKIMILGYLPCSVSLKQTLQAMWQSGIRLLLYSECAILLTLEIPQGR